MTEFNRRKFLEGSAGIAVATTVGTGAAVTPTVPAVVASAGSPALAFTGADGVVPMGIFGLLALVLGTGLAAAAHRVTRE